jgi:Flp pilus assembly protein TadB
MELTAAFLGAFVAFLFALALQYQLFERQEKFQMKMLELQQKFQKEMQKEQQDFQERMKGVQMQFQKVLFDADSIGRTQAAEYQRGLDVVAAAELRAFWENLLSRFMR